MRLLIVPESSLSVRRCTTVISQLSECGSDAKGGSMTELLPAPGAGGRWPPAHGTFSCDKVPVKSAGGGNSFSLEVTGGTGRAVSPRPAERSPVEGPFGEGEEG